MQNGTVLQVEDGVTRLLFSCEVLVLYLFMLRKRERGRKGINIHVFKVYFSEIEKFNKGTET